MSPRTATRNCGKEASICRAAFTEAGFAGGVADDGDVVRDDDLGASRNSFAFAMPCSIFSTIPSPMAQAAAARRCIRCACPAGERACGWFSPEADGGVRPVEALVVDLLQGDIRAPEFGVGTTAVQDLHPVHVLQMRIDDGDAVFWVFPKYLLFR